MNMCVHVVNVKRILNVSVSILSDGVSKTTVCAVWCCQLIWLGRGRPPPKRLNAAFFLNGFIVT